MRGSRLGWFFQISFACILTGALFSSFAKAADDAFMSLLPPPDGPGFSLYGLQRASLIGSESKKVWVKEEALAKWVAKARTNQAGVGSKLDAPDSIAVQFENFVQRMAKKREVALEEPVTKVYEPKAFLPDLAQWQFRSARMVGLASSGAIESQEFVMGLGRHKSVSGHHEAMGWAALTKDASGEIQRDVFNTLQRAGGPIHIARGSASYWVGKNQKTQEYVVVDKRLIENKRNKAWLKAVNRDGSPAEEQDIVWLKRFDEFSPESDAAEVLTKLNSKPLPKAYCGDR
jgi:hypothetical protein